MKKSWKDSYKKSGVDVEQSGRFVEDIKPLVQKTHRKGVLGSLGAFSGFFEIDWKNYVHPVLLSATDGVGTKLLVAQKAESYHSIGIDLVAMCVNDILVHGGNPLFFLDYISVGKLDPTITYQIVEGITKGCLESECSLIGGETAEMPSVYQNNEFDLAGFCVGIVEKDRIINGQNIAQGDRLLGLPSSGLHSNGYALVRKILFEKQGLTCDSLLFDGVSVGEELLRPTKIYAKIVKHLLKQCTPKAFVHITGGGFHENIPRILPRHLTFEIIENSWPILPIFEYLQKEEKLSCHEMQSIFNCGIGFVIIVSAEETKRVQNILKNIGENSYLMGEVVPKTSDGVSRV